MNRGIVTTGLFNLTQKRVMARKVRYCNRFWSRVVGLLGTTKAEPKQACWIIPCNGVHTFGMKYPIDAFFLNKQNKIIAVFRNLKPNRTTPILPKAHSVVEFASGWKQKVSLGDKLALGGVR